jgi:osmoprotectant transport system permease protein
VILLGFAVDEGCLVANDWICGEYLVSRADDIVAATAQHVALAAVSLAIAVVVAFPLAVLARRSAWAEGFVLGASTVLYTIPSLALFALLLPLTGITPTTVVIGLVLYSLTVLVRALVEGLASVPADALEAARGMGMSPRRVFWRVELPLAQPTAFAGLRVAAVSTVALVTIGFVVGYGGLGNLIDDGLDTYFRPQVLTATVLCVLLAVLFDLAVLALEWLATPWRRGRTRAG